MSLAPLLVATCFAEAVWRTSAAPFNFQEDCKLNHLHSKYFATCNGESVEEKNLALNGDVTQHTLGVNLTSFQSITFDSSVEIPRISVSNASQVSLFLSNPQLTDLQIDNVDELTLQYEHGLHTQRIPHIANMVLNNINTLRLVSNAEEFVWPIRSVNLTKVDDVDLGSSLLNVFAEHVVIAKTRIRLNSKTSLFLNASSIAIDSSFIYIHENGFMDVTVDQITVRDSHVNLEDGYFNLVNAREVLFTKNSLHGFNNRPLLVHDNAGVRFEKNDIFTHDIGGVLSLSERRVIFKGNSFGCYDCADNRRLLDSDLQDSGDVNYCYTSCNLTLNAFKKHLADSCLCTDGARYVGQDRLCASNMICTKIFGGIYLLWWILIVLIPLLLIIFLVFCICHMKKRKNKLKSKQSHQRIAFDNVCYYKFDNYLGHHYEEVD